MPFSVHRLMSCFFLFLKRLFLFSSSSVDLPRTPVPRRERLDSDSSTTSEKTENSEALQELDLEVQPMMKLPPSGLSLKNKLPDVKKEVTTSNLKHGSRRTTTAGKQSRYSLNLLNSLITCLKIFFYLTLSFEFTF